MDKQDFQDYKLEIEELTNLLHNEWLDLKNLIIAHNIHLAGTLLVNYYEDEEGVEYGLLYNKKENFIIQFNVINNKILLTPIKHIDEIKDEYPQLLVAMDFD